MRSYPQDDEDKKEIERMNAYDWMIECLKMNPDYVYWGPYEDYMTDEKGQWSSRQIFETWGDFGPWELDELNEIVNFYFKVDREAENCKACGACGFNPETYKLSQNWYGFEEEPNWVYLDANLRYNNNAWQYHLTDIEVDALWEAGRLCYNFEEKPTPNQVNKWAKTGIGHDGINHHICLQARGEHLGIYGLCSHCEGEGSVYTEPEAKLGLVLWILHPRKGCSRGIHIKEITQEQLPEVIKYLQAAAERNAERFLKLK